MKILFLRKGFWSTDVNSGLELASVWLNLIWPGLFEGGAAWGGGGGRRWKVPTAYNSKTINDNEIKLGGVVKDQ